MKEKIRRLPEEPGCYIFKDRNKKIVYIGKANNLKKRVSSYFKKKDHEPKTRAMVSKVRDVGFILTKNEIEALILENNLIKKHKPRYNIELKDSKSYSYIEETKETFPRFIIHRKTDTSKKKDLFGPFTSGKKRQDILRLINKTFKIRTCKRLPRRSCLRYSIGICSAPCINKISREDYLEKVNAARKVLKGKIKEVIEETKKKMQKASEKHEYERAIEYREQIRSLEYLEEKQNIERKRRFDEDIINYIEKKNKVYVALFNVYKGTLNNKEEYTFDKIGEPLEQFLKQYYSENKIPKEIIIPKVVDPAIKDYLEEKKRGKVNITIPKKGPKKELLRLVKKNIETSSFREDEKLERLKDAINLRETPETIEGFDVSHLSGKHTVASMVQFKNARQNKENYRRFKIRTVEKNDDFASMKEAIRRRYKRLIQEKSAMPNLILVDGGRGQLNAALETLEELDIKIPVISLAKKEEEIYTPASKEPIRLKKNDKASLFLQEIRDEAHRFAIKYNKNLRKKALKSKNPSKI